jgi:hypothetical protein
MGRSTFTASGNVITVQTHGATVPASTGVATVFFVFHQRTRAAYEEGRRHSGGRCFRRHDAHHPQT